MTPLELIDRLAGVRALVIGEAMLDSYLHGHVDRLCREAPVPIIAVDGCNETLGGAANTALSVRALGAEVTFLSVIGADDAGGQIEVVLADAGVETLVFRAPGRTTMVKQRVSGNHQLLVRLDRGSEEDIDALHERRLLDVLAARWEDYDTVIAADYGYGILTPALVDAIAVHQRRAPLVLMVDAKNLGRWRGVGATAVKPNYAEALALIGAAPVSGTMARVEQMIDSRRALAAATGSEIIAATLDTAGAVVFEGDAEPYRTFTKPSPDSHAAGAGDIFTGGMALALAAGAHTAAAADLASAAATACVASSGTTVCTATMLREALLGREKLADGGRLAERLAKWRMASKRLVFTNGCFDLLHHGHIGYLNRAKAMGDILIVGLNADSSVRALKGSSRPINGEDDRAAVLAALSCVDLVVVFAEPTPALLIEQIRPDLYVKGGDYTLATLPEAPQVARLGGEVKLLPYLDNRSTSGIIERIRRAYFDERRGAVA